MHGPQHEPLVLPLSSHATVVTFKPYFEAKRFACGSEFIRITLFMTSGRESGRQAARGTSEVVLFMASRASIV